MKKSDIGLIGLAVMGENLVMNMESKGFTVSVYNRTTEKVKNFVCVEMSMGQMIEDVRLATECKKPVSLCNRCGGMIVSPDEVLESIRKAQKGEV